MNRFLLPTFLLLVIHAYSQPLVNRFAIRHGLSGGIDAGVAVKNGVVNPDLTYYELISLNRKKSVFIGWMARLSAFYGNRLDYYTAPARLTRLPAVDTVSFDRLSQTALNLGLRAEYNLGRVQLGASVDLLGLTFLGRSRIGRVSSSTGLFAGQDSLGQPVAKPFRGADAYQRASPTRLNLRLFGDNERGMLSTDVYARVYVFSRTAVRVGYRWLTTEVTMRNADQVAGNDRFRNRMGLLYVGLTVPLTPW